jgi:hypothetical protein
MGSFYNQKAMSIRDIAEKNSSLGKRTGLRVEAQKNR